VTKVLSDAFPGVFTRQWGVQATKGCGSSLEITLGYGLIASSETKPYGVWLRKLAECELIKPKLLVLRWKSIIHLGD
jgi:hypothetical protein